jgi:hypothetical protein
MKNVFTLRFHLNKEGGGGGGSSNSSKNNNNDTNNKKTTMIIISELSIKYKFPLYVFVRKYTSFFCI